MKSATIIIQRSGISRSALQTLLDQWMKDGAYNIVIKMKGVR